MNCPNCNGEMWDNTVNKKNPKGPDYKCKDPNCLDPKSGMVTAVWLPKGEKVFEGTKPKKILVPTGHPNPAQNNNDLKKFILNNASALTIKFMEGMATQQMWLNEEELDAFLERRIKAIAGMMMGLQI